MAWLRRNAFPSAARNQTDDDRPRWRIGPRQHRLETRQRRTTETHRPARSPKPAISQPVTGSNDKESSPGCLRISQDRKLIFSVSQRIQRLNSSDLRALKNRKSIAVNNAQRIAKRKKLNTPTPLERTAWLGRL